MSAVVNHWIDGKDFEVMKPDLLATCWTTAGTAIPAVGDEICPWSLENRMQEAANLGFKGFGILHTDLLKAVNELGTAGVVALVNSFNFEFIELEMINDWFADGERREKSDSIRKFLLDMAAKLGAIHIKIGSEINGTEWPWDHLVAELKFLGKQAKESGTKIALEVMPFTQIKSVEMGVDLVDAVGEDSVGLLLDNWHVYHGGTSYEWLSKLSSRYIFGVELDDADSKIEKNMFYDTVHNRKYCGEGDFNVKEFIKAILSTGYKGPFGVEILSDSHRKLPLKQALTLTRDTTLAQF